jgi:vanillate O-demethylase ferredoxin subunit
MLEAFERACANVPSQRVHVEYFAAKEAPAAEGGFVVELARSKKTIPIARGMTILEALLAAGVDAPYSCMEGVCATCETKVLAGIPDHKDLVLTKEEREATDDDDLLLRQQERQAGARSLTSALAGAWRQIGRKRPEAVLPICTL